MDILDDMGVSKLPAKVLFFLKRTTPLRKKGSFAIQKMLILEAIC